MKEAKNSDEKPTCDCSHLPPRRDCLQFLQDGYTVNGMYKLHINDFKSINVFCDQSSFGGGWIII